MTSRTRLTISLRYVARILDAAAAAGVSSERLCREANLAPPPYPRIDDRIDVAPYLALWRAAATATGDPALALKVARVQSMSAYDVFGFACKTSATLGDAFAAARRYLPLFTNAAIWEIAEEADGTRIVFRPWGKRRPETRWVDEFAIAELVWAGHILTGVEWRPRSVHFAHAAPKEDDLEPFRALFAAPIRFDADAGESSIVIDAAVLALPLVDADPELATFFARHADTLLDDRSGDEAVAPAVRRLLARAMVPGGTPTLDEIARGLHLSGRTLRRRLEVEGATFQAILDDVRAEAALRLIAEEAVSIGSIASSLGFADERALRRAFVRWTGSPPVAYRRALAPR